MYGPSKGKDSETEARKKKDTKRRDEDTQMNRVFWVESPVKVDLYSKG